MTQDDLEKEIRELRSQIEALRSALSDVTRPYTELMAYVGRLQDVSRGYFRILDLYAKYGKVSPDLVIPGLKDDISRHIVVALFDRPDRNISQITEAVKRKRGTASRRIVRERLEDLERQGIVVATPGSRTRTVRVAAEVAVEGPQRRGLMSDRGDRLPVILLEVLPVLAARFGWDFLRYQARRKRGVRAFRRALLRSGMSRDRVEVLTRAYHDVGSVRRLLRTGRAAFR